MKRLMLIACMAALTGGVSFQTFAETDTPAQEETFKPATEGAKVGEWTMDFEGAKKLAAEKKLPMLLNFTGSDWCGWCKLMDKNVFKMGEWEDYAKENLILVWIDFPQDKSLVPEAIAAKNDKLKDAFNVEGYPTYFVVDSDGETQLGQLGASQSASPAWFIGEIEKVKLNRAGELEKWLTADEAAELKAAREARTEAEKAFEDARAEFMKIMTEARKKVEEKMQPLREAREKEDALMEKALKKKAESAK